MRTATILSCLLASQLLAQDCPDPEATINLIFQTRNTRSSPELFAAAAPSAEEGSVERAAPRGQVYVGIVSQLESFGVQGWSLSVRSEGELELRAATTSGTAADEEDRGGLQTGGFEKTEVVGGAARGVISAVILSFVSPVTLEPRGTTTVLALTLEGEAGQSSRLSFEDGLQGSGQPVPNVLTVDGHPLRDFCTSTTRVEFVGLEGGFRIGEVNFDRRIDVGDAVFLLNFLFRGSSTPACLETADANSDERYDISDAIFLIKYNLSGGPPPIGIEGCTPLGAEHNCAESAPDCLEAPNGGGAGVGSEPASKKARPGPGSTVSGVTGKTLSSSKAARK